MANKRSAKVESVELHPKKRQCKGAGKNMKSGSSGSPRAQLSKIKGKDTAANHAGVIDLSEDKAALSAKPRIIMKQLPPNLDRSQFPRFNDGSVYIIIHPYNNHYQYKLHENILSGLSTKLRGLLSSKKDELDDTLKAEVTNANFRFDLVYSSSNRHWALRKETFTAFKSRKSASDTERSNDVSIHSETPGGSEGEVIQEFPTPRSSVSAVIDKSVQHPRDGAIAPITSVPTDDTGKVDNLECVSAADEIKTTFILQNEQEVANTDPGQLVPARTIDGSTPNIGCVSAKVEMASEEELFVINSTHLSETHQSEFALTENTADAIKQEVDSVKQHQDTMDKEICIAGQEPPIEKSTDEYMAIQTSTQREGEVADEKMEHDDPELDKIAAMDNTGAEYANRVMQHEDSNQEPKVIETDQADDISLSSQANLSNQVSESSQGGVDDTRDAGKNDYVGQMFEVIQAQEMNYDGAAASRHDTNGAKSTQPQKLPINELPKIDLLRDVIPTEPPVEVCESYNNLFLIFYRKSPIISTKCVSMALQQCEAVLALAIRLESVSIVRPYLGIALSQFGKELHISIMTEPIRWLKLSIGLRLASIFREAVIHITGACPTVPKSVDDHNYIPAYFSISVRRLLVRKIHLLQLWKLQVNEVLFMSTIRIGEDLVTFSPKSTSTFPTWLVVQVWRDWFCHQLTDKLDHPQEVGKLYRTLAKGRDAYLLLEEFQALLGALGLSSEAEMLQGDLDIMKDFAQQAVKDICENKSMLNVDEVPSLGYLTCTWVENEELPWMPERGTE